VGVSWYRLARQSGFLSGPRPDDHGLVDVAWGERYLVTFATDLGARSQEIMHKSLRSTHIYC
jgi:hypothetical protein